MRNFKHSLNEDDVKEVGESAHSFTGADLLLACREATLLALKNDVNLISTDLLKKCLKNIKPSAMREITLEVPKVRWSDIGGMEHVKKKLKQAVVWRFKHKEALKRVGAKPKKGILLYGPPGCSKTMIGKALATESGLNFLAIKGPELFNKWVGESERAVREVFRKAKQASPAILFFDEIDALAAERGGGATGSSNSSTVGDRVLAQLLTELDGIENLDDVFIIAATNRPDMIDRALLRPGRIGDIVYVPLPDKTTRKEIFEISTREIPLDFEENKNEELEKLAARTDGYSGAEIAAICQEAAYFALEKDIEAKNVTFGHFEQALDSIPPRISKEMTDYYDKYASKFKSLEK